MEIDRWWRLNPLTITDCYDTAYVDETSKDAIESHSHNTVDGWMDE